MHPYERMECGHFARYEFTKDDRESYCAICELLKALAEVERLKAELASGLSVPIQPTP